MTTHSRLIPGIAALSLSTVCIADPVWTIIPVPGAETTITVPSNGVRTVQYTVTNTSPNQPHQLIMNPLVAGIAQVVTGLGSCAAWPFSLVPHESCTLTLQIDGARLIGAVPPKTPTLCQNDLPKSTQQCYGPTQADQLSIRPTGPAAPFVSVGNYTDQRLSAVNTPLVAQSLDLGATWAAINTAGLGQVPGYLQSVSCTGDGFAGARCVAVGQAYDNNEGAVALISMTNFDGSTWSDWVGAPYGNGGGNSSSSYFNSVSCTGGAEGAMCVAVGQVGGYTDSLGQATFPLAAYTYFNGSVWSNWTLITGYGGPVAFPGFLNSVSCASVPVEGYGFCIAGGQDTSDGNQPLMLGFFANYSTPDNYAFATDLTTGAGGVINGVSCTNNQGCMMVGQDYTNNAPLVGVINMPTESGLFYGDLNWGGETNLETVNGNLTSVSCVNGSGTTDTYCAAAGQDLIGNAALTAQFSLNSLATVILDAYDSPSGYRSVSCINDETNISCAFGGEYNNQPFASMISGPVKGDWNATGTTQTIGEDAGVINGVDCIGTPLYPHCVFSGIDYNTSQPLVSYNYNGANFELGSVLGLLDGSFSYFRGVSGPNNDSSISVLRLKAMNDGAEHSNDYVTKKGGHHVSRPAVIQPMPFKPANMRCGKGMKLSSRLASKFHLPKAIREFCAKDVK